jgi:hypothetical protein
VEQDSKAISASSRRAVSGKDRGVSVSPREQEKRIRIGIKSAGMIFPFLPKAIKKPAMLFLFFLSQDS